MSEFIRFTDLTSLREVDTEASIAAFVEGALCGAPDSFPAAICVYPSMAMATSNSLTSI